MTLSHIGLSPNTSYTSVYVKVGGQWVKVVKTTSDGLIVSDSLTSTKRVCPSQVRKVKAVIGETVTYLR